MFLTTGDFSLGASPGQKLFETKKCNPYLGVRLALEKRDKACLRRHVPYYGGGSSVPLTSPIVLSDSLPWNQNLPLPMVARVEKAGLRHRQPCETVYPYFHHVSGLSHC